MKIFFLLERLSLGQTYGNMTVNGFALWSEITLEARKTQVANRKNPGIERIVLLDFIHCLVSQKIEELKIYTKYHNTHVHKIHTRFNY
jgi:hypothetical protein